LRPVDFDLLQTIVALADSGSCNGAAEIVGRSQSAVLIKLKKLEQLLDTALYQRSGRSLALNDRGWDVVAAARQILRLNQDLVRRVTATRLDGTIRPGLPDDYGAMVMPGDNLKFAVEMIAPIAMEENCALPSARAAAPSAQASCRRF